MFYPGRVVGVEGAFPTCAAALRNVATARVPVLWHAVFNRRCDVLLDALFLIIIYTHVHNTGSDGDAYYN